MTTLIGIKSQIHWFQINLKRKYFVTKLIVGLRMEIRRQKWQTGLTPYTSQTPIRVNAENGDMNPQDRCGEPYAVRQGQTPTFSCHAETPSQYVVLTLKPLFEAGIQVCDVQIFGRYS